MYNMFCKLLFFTFFLPSLQVSTIGPVQCFDGCTSTPSLLALKPTIGDCCGVQGVNAGGFLTVGGTMCTDCSRFRTLNARINIFSSPELAILDSGVRILCQVQTEELLCPSGSLFLQLPNRTVITTVILSSITEIELVIAAASSEDLGRYYCNISIVSPQFPNIGLRAFEGLQLQIQLASLSTRSLSIIPNGATSISSDGIRPTVISSVPTVSITTSVTNTDTVVPLPTKIDVMPTLSTQSTTNIMPTPTIPDQTSAVLDTSIGTNPEFTSILESSMVQFSSVTVTDIFQTSITSISPESSSSVLSPSSSMSLPLPSPIPPDPTILCLRFPIVGRKYELTCHSNRLSLQMLWTSSNGHRIQNDDNIIVGKTKKDYFRGKTSLTIHFRPFLVEHIGRYTCWSDVNSVNVLISIVSRSIVH